MNCAIPNLQRNVVVSSSIRGDFAWGTLAEMIGTTRSRVSFFMNKFRKLGLINYNGKIEVNNSLLSAVLHEKPQLKENQ
jgi:CRP/FNR family cyclic AMP-dependent transcriptional regulator